MVVFAKYAGPLTRPTAHITVSLITWIPQIPVGSGPVKLSKGTQETPPSDVSYKFIVSVAPNSPYPTLPAQPFNSSKKPTERKCV